MSFTSLEQQFDGIEQQFNAVSAALIDGDPQTVHAASAQLQQLTVDLVQVLDRVGRHHISPAPLALRVKAIAEGLPVLRENLLRRSMYVERALQVVVPATAKTTYAAQPGPYGHGVRQSGAFKVFSA
jgi:hypothetical protein